MCSLERHDALYVVGALDETLELRGLRYHPIDIETSISRMHRSIAEWYSFMQYIPYGKIHYLARV